MIDKLKNMMGIGAIVDYGQLIKEGAIILDVRSRSEYASGHVNGSINIPLDKFEDVLTKIKNKDQVIITCCASGMRSSSAKRILEKEGYTKVYNGGSWLDLDKYSK
jgi:phage shock protein E